MDAGVYVLFVAGHEARRIDPSGAGPGCFGISIMLCKIEKFCQEYKMLSPGAPVIVCVSGGVDSMCLLDVLAGLREQIGFPLYAAHYNHRLRGAESDGDEAFVREQCELRRIPLYVGSGDVAGEAKRRGLGVEETARTMRYVFFRELTLNLGGARIATAHNSDDNVETVLMRMVRGTGLRGLCGIPPVAGDLIRPLLCVSRAEIEGYCREHGVPHREDSSNDSDDYTRNRLRHAVMPVLRELNPSLTVLPMTELLRRDEEYLCSLARDFLRDRAPKGRVDAGALAALPFPVASRAVRALFGEKLGAVHVRAVLDLASRGGPSDRVSLPGIVVRREYDVLTAEKIGGKNFPETEIPLDKSVIIKDIGLRLTLLPWEKGGIYNSLTNFLIKRDKIKAGLSVRPRKAGDVLRLPGGSRSVKRLMIDRRIPADVRDTVPVVVSGDEVLAVFGLGQSADTLPTEGDPAVLLKIEKTEG